MKPRLIKRPEAERHASRPVERREARYRQLDKAIAKLEIAGTNTSVACAVSEVFGTVPAGSIERMKHTDAIASTDIKYVAATDRATGSCIDPGGFRDAKLSRMTRDWIRNAPIIAAITDTIGKKG